jgi:uncharacterized membrane protein
MRATVSAETFDPAAPTAGTMPRLAPIDALRGLVMVVMALDHTREFFHSGAMTFQPEDLTQTTPALFLTRWITHICAPVFVFSAGMGAFLKLQRDGSKTRLSRFLWTRGLWLIVIELTVMRLAMNFTPDTSFPIFLLVLFAIGMSMIALAGLIYLPYPLLAAGSVAFIVFYNTTDGIPAAQLGAFGELWQVLRQGGVFQAAGMLVIVGYPVLPWLAVMTAGFCFGRVFLMEPARPQRVLLLTGTGLIIGFVALRTLNVYGDPAPWTAQQSATFTLLSFLRATKYPPSLAFLLMTLGPALLVLAWFGTRRLGPRSPLVVIGRVPFFYYVLHFWMIHVLAAAAAWLRYGSSAFEFLFMPFPSMGGPRETFPADFGYPLWAVYLAWVSVVLLMYPLCRWFVSVKARRRDWWLGYV